MWNEISRKIRLLFDLLSARAITSFRKLQIKHAYHPVRIILPIIMIVAVFSAVIGFTISAIYSFYNDESSEVALEEILVVDTASIEETPLDYVFAPFPAIEEHDEMQFLIVADKYDRVIHLLKNQRGTWGIIKSYPVAIGAAAGRKELQWDKKTPEGNYFIVSRKEDAELNEIYGPLAYVLNYPNPEDRIAGRTGNGIWIHGTVPGKVPVDTKGCLEMHNNNILKLADYIGSGDLIPVVIHNSSSFNIECDVDLAALWEEREQVIQSRNPIAETDSAEIDTTSTVIVSDTAPEVDIAETVAENDTVETVAVVTAVPENQADTAEMVVEVEQIAETEQVDSVTEVEDEPELVQKDYATVAREVIEKWRTDWQSMDIERYQMNYDHQLFESGDYNWERWRAKKVRTFNNYSSITVDVSRLEILSHTNTSIVVKFLQKYQSDLFRAENGKQITLQNRTGNWKIVQELSVRY